MHIAGNMLKSKRYTEEERFMSDFDVKEKRFEQDIEEYLITEGGYCLLYTSPSPRDS